MIAEATCSAVARRLPTSVPKVPFTPTLFHASLYVLGTSSSFPCAFARMFSAASEEPANKALHARSPLLLSTTFFLLLEWTGMFRLGPALD